MAINELGLVLALTRDTVNTNRTMDRHIITWSTTDWPSTSLVYWPGDYLLTEFELSGREGVSAAAPETKTCPPWYQKVQPPPPSPPLTHTCIEYSALRLGIVLAIYFYTVSRKMHQLWNNCKDRFWWNFSEIFKRLFSRVYMFQFSCRFAFYQLFVFQTRHWK